MALNNFELGTTTSTTASHVFCAVNLFNQPDVYRFGSYNGYCFDTSKGQNGMLPSVGMCSPLQLSSGVGQEQTDSIIAGFGRRPGYSRCKVNFVGSQYADHPTPGRWSKRGGEEKPTNEHGGWEIESMFSIIFSLP
jgi:hypothetical protein